MEASKNLMGIVLLAMCPATIFAGGATPVSPSQMFDFSNAGRSNRGDRDLQIPTQTTVNLDTQAFRSAPRDTLQSAIRSNTLILLPAGVFNFDKMLFISGVNNVVVRGNGTTIRFTKSLTDLMGNTINGPWGSAGRWHIGGGMINIGKKYPYYTGSLPSLSACSNIGFENLTVDFSRSSFASYVQAGWNAFYLNTVSQSYFKNVRMVNFDHGIIAMYTSFSTFKSIHFSPIRGAHLGVALIEGSQNNLITNVFSDGAIQHGLSVSGTRYSVFKNSTLQGATGITHRGSTSAYNLFCNLNLPDSLRFSGGSNGSTGPKETYWNVSSARALHDKFDVYWNQPVADLHEAQLTNRIGSGGGTTPEPTPDIQKPTTPGGISAIAQSSSAVLVSWSASTDNVGVKEYDVYRGTVKVATVTGTSFSNTGLTPSTTYSFKVQARDAAGNLSDFSAVASATTQSGPIIPPPPPTGGVIYEAEAANVFGAKKYGAYVDYINNSGDYIEWTINVATAGNYSLGFKYAYGSGSRPLEIKVDGVVKAVSLSFPATGSTSIYKTVSTQVTLGAGIHKVRATAIGSSGGNMDSLTVTKL